MHWRERRRVKFAKQTRSRIIPNSATTRFALPIYKIFKERFNKTKPNRNELAVSSQLPVHIWVGVRRPSGCASSMPIIRIGFSSCKLRIHVRSTFRQDVRSDFWRSARRASRRWRKLQSGLRWADILLFMLLVMYSLLHYAGWILGACQ